MMTRNQVIAPHLWQEEGEVHTKSLVIYLLIIVQHTGQRMYLTIQTVKVGIVEVYRYHILLLIDHIHILRIVWISHIIEDRSLLCLIAPNKLLYVDERVRCHWEQIVVQGELAITIVLTLPLWILKGLGHSLVTCRTKLTARQLVRYQVICHKHIQAAGTVGIVQSLA